MRINNLDKTNEIKMDRNESHQNGIKSEQNESNRIAPERIEANWIETVS